MTGKRLASKLMIAALVVVPVSGAAMFIAVVARDTAEVASALAAGAGALFIASFFQIGLFFRDVQAIAAREAESRGHALTLARCLKDLTRRIAVLETAPQPATACGDPAAAQGQSDALSGTGAAAVERCTRLVAPAPPRPAERRILTLPQRRLAGIEVLMPTADDRPDEFTRGFGALAADSGLRETIATAALMIEGDVQPASAFILVAAPANLTLLPEAMALLEHLASSSETARDRLRLGISHASVRAGGMAQAAVLARLARAGLSYMLTDVDAEGLDLAALKACNITHLEIDADRLLAAGETGARFAGRCSEAGLTLVAGGVDDPRQIAELIELGVPLAMGDGFARDVRAKAGIAAVPHRRGDAPDEPPDLMLRVEDSVRYRAAG